VTLGASARHRTEHPRICPGGVHCLVSMMLLFSSVVGLVSSYPTWASVYQCRDAAGKSVLTNRPSQLRNCFVLSEETPSAPTPPEASATPQDSPPPMNSDISPPPSYAPPMPPNRQADTQGSSISSPPPPNPGASLSPSPPQPCSRGLNPFNPLSAPPCVQSEKSGAKPSGATPAPSQ
jgi:hypothetical protein